MYRLYHCIRRRQLSETCVHMFYRVLPYIGEHIFLVLLRLYAVITYIDSLIFPTASEGVRRKKPVKISVTFLAGIFCQSQPRMYWTLTACLYTLTVRQRDGTGNLPPTERILLKRHFTVPVNAVLVLSITGACE